MQTYRKKRAFINKKKAAAVAGVICAVLVILFLASLYIFEVNAISYEGSERYGDEELTNMIFGRDKPNALFYTLNKEQKDIPFVQKYDVEIVWPDKMKVTIYEKAVVGYVTYMGSCMYFDKDGLIVESSSENIEGVPEIKGLKYKSIVLNSKLEVNDDSIFDYILDVTQTLDKYGLEADVVYFDKDYNLMLYLDRVKVIIGNSEYSTERLNVLKNISGELAGLSGTLDLSNYNGDESSIVLKKELKNY